MKVDPEMVAIVDNFAENLEIHPQTIKDLHRVRDNHLKRLLIDYERRSLGEFLGLDPAQKVIKGVISMFHQAIGDLAVSECYQQLESFPEGESWPHCFPLVPRQELGTAGGEKEHV